MPGGRGGELLVADMVQWFGLVAFLCGGDQPWRPGRGLEQPALPSLSFNLNSIHIRLYVAYSLIGLIST